MVLSKRNGMRSIGIFILVLLVACTACTSVGANDTTIETERGSFSTPTPTLSLVEGGPSFVVPDDGIKLSQKQIDAIGSFSDAFFEHARKESNALISPVSAYIALSMAAIGSNGETAQAFERALGLNSQELLLVYKALQRMLPTTGLSKFEMLNAAFLSTKTSFYQSYVDAAEEVFAARVEPIQDVDPVAQVNRWSSEATHGHIPELITKEDLEKLRLTNATAFFLVNALYMHAVWKLPFQSAQTREAPFFPSVGKETTALFMNRVFTREEEVYYFKTDDAQGILLPYLDSDLLFLAALPIGKDIGELKIRNIGNWIDAATVNGGYEELALSLPKIDRQYAVTLDGWLKNDLGLNLAMDPNNADFSNMVPPKLLLNNNIYLATCIQKTSLRVDEAGTEGAGVSVVVGGFGAHPSKDYYQLVFDRPFIYAVVDANSEIPFFLGVLEDF